MSSPSAAEGGGASLAAGLLAEAHPHKILASLFAGLVVGLSGIVTGIGVAALAFPGPLQEHVFAAVGVVLFGAMVMLVVTSLTSSYSGTICVAQEAPAAILGLLCASLSGPLAREMPPQDMVATLIVAIAASTIFTGLCFYLLGRFRVGGLIRFIPYPVMGGVLAGLGWLLLQGGLSVLAGETLRIETAAFFLEPDTLLRVGLGAAVGLVLLSVTRRVHHYLTLPGLLAGGIALFYAVVFLLGGDLQSVSEGGWLLGPFPEGRAWEPIRLSTVAALDWWLLLKQVPIIGTVVLVSTISILLYASGVEVAVRQDMDLNRELRSCGIANCLAGLGGGVPGFHSMSDSILAKEMGAPNRLTGIFAAAVIGAGLFLGFSVLSFFPRPVLGGLLFFMGFSLLIDWVYEAWFKLPKGDYLIVVTILLVSAWFGYLEAIGVGIVAGIALFTVNYSRIDVAKHVVSGAAFRSNVDRPDDQRRALDVLGTHLQTMVLQGFLFFGTANRVLEQIRARCEDTALPRLEFLVLDFRLVSGFDTSSLMTFKKLQQYAEDRDFRLVLTNLPEEGRQALREADIDGAPDGVVTIFPDLDHGLEWCEDALLGAASRQDAGGTRAATGEKLSETIANLGAYLEEVDLPAGAHVIRQGEPSNDMFFVREGRVTVRLEGPQDSSHRLRTYGPGTIVGEVAMYLDAPRSAAVIADTPVRLLRLTREGIDRLTRDDPAAAAAFHRFLVRLLCERLTSTNQQLQSVL